MGPTKEELADGKSLSRKGHRRAYIDFNVPDKIVNVGDKHQAEIPPLISRSDYIVQTEHVVQKLKKPNEHEEHVGKPKLIVIRYKGHSINTGVYGCMHNNKLITKKPGEPGNCHAQQATVSELLREFSEKYWNKKEKASFILGLYIFGKNFAQVKRFVGSKSMGDILSFYYGKFCKSERYQRWSKCRKMGQRRSIYGQKIFTGARQRELLSRLLPNVSEECCDHLRKVSEAFNKRKMALEDYVSCLMESVGLSTLVEAVEVGTENDLTGFSEKSKAKSCLSEKCNAKSLEPREMLAVRQEVPAANPCFSLTLEEIKSRLTGKFRRDKYRSSELFWDAVWPRLLAKGWHSEQPGGSHDYALASEHSLVFLSPEVEKFSSKLVKGKQYLDSVNDVLGLVACNHKLIEFDTDAVTGNNMENHPEKNSSARKLRGIPLGVLDPNSFDNKNEVALEERIIEPKKNGFTKAIGHSNGKTTPSDMVGAKNNPSRELLSVTGARYANSYGNFKKQRMDKEVVLATSPSTEELGKKSLQRPVIENHPRKNRSAKKRRSQPLGALDPNSFHNNNEDALDMVGVKNNPSREQLSVSGTWYANSYGTFKKRRMDNKDSVPSTEELGKKSLQRPETQQNNAKKEFGDHSERTISQPVDKCQHQHETNDRRQSTRKRSMTLKAVEAREYEEFERKEKRRKWYGSTDSSISRPSPRACHRVMISETTGNNEDKENGTSKHIGRNNVLKRTCSKSQEEIDFG